MQFLYYNKTPAEAVSVAAPAGVFILKYARETAGDRFFCIRIIKSDMYTLLLNQAAFQIVHIIGTAVKIIELIVVLSVLLCSRSSCL